MARSYRLLFGGFIVSAALAGAATAQAPKGWGLAGSRPTEYEAGVEAGGSGKVAFIRARPNPSEGFGTLMQVIQPAEYRSKRVRLSASMKTSEANRAQMWMRVDGPERRNLAFDNMATRPVTGTTGWKRYEIVLDVPQDAVAIAYGFFLSGRGQVWADDFKLEEVGRNVPVTGGSVGPRNLSFEESRRQADAAQG